MLLPVLISIQVACVCYVKLANAQTAQPVSSEPEFVIRLGGIFSIYPRRNDEHCDETKVLRSSNQFLEMAIYTIERVNNDVTMLPGVTLTIDPMADCTIDTRALKEIVQNYLPQQLSQQSTRNNSYWGVIGPSSSAVSIPTAKLLGLFDFSQISYAATSPNLSDKQRYPYFFRTTSSDKFQVRAIIQVLQMNGWEYVSFIHDNDDYGNAASEEFQKQITETNICLSANIRFPRNAGKKVINDVAQSLIRETRSRVIIAFASIPYLALLMSRLIELGYGNRFQWIGSDIWNGFQVQDLQQFLNDTNDEALHQVMDGSLSFSGHSRPDPEFENYLKPITLNESLDRNLFYAHYLASLHGCSLPGSSSVQQNVCLGNLTLPNSTELSHMLQTSANAVLAFAHAFNDAQQDLCNGTGVPVCDAFTKLNGIQIRKYLQNVSFIDGNQERFQFDQFQDGPASYDIWRYNGTEQKWKLVGYYAKEKITFTDNRSEKGRGNITSVCSDPCALNQYMLVSEERSCCWHCITCKENSIVIYNVSNSGRNVSKCQSCGNQQMTDSTFQTCLPVPVDYLSFSHGWAWGVICVSCVGLVLTICTGIVYICHWDTPIVRASGRELCCMILVGLLLTFTLSFFFCFEPTKPLCVMRRLSTGLCLTLVYSAILVKTVRISLIFNTLGKKLVRDYKKLLKPMPQLIIAIVLSAVEVFLLIIWFVMQPPNIVKSRSHKEGLPLDYVQCQAMMSQVILIGLFYPILLVLVCTYYAIKVRKVPAGFNEAKHIGFAVYTALVICIAQIPTYVVNTSSNIVLRDAIYCLGLSLNGLVILFAMFGPKTYIIIFRPQKNNQTTVMGHQSGSRNQSSTWHQRSVSEEGVTQVAAPKTPEIKRKTNVSFLNNNSNNISTDWGRYGDGDIDFDVTNCNVISNMAMKNVTIVPNPLTKFEANGEVTSQQRNHSVSTVNSNVIRNDDAFKNGDDVSMTSVDSSDWKRTFMKSYDILAISIKNKPVTSSDDDAIDIEGTKESRRGSFENETFPTQLSSFEDRPKHRKCSSASGNILKGFDNPAFEFPNGMTRTRSFPNNADAFRNRKQSRVITNGSLVPTSSIKPELRLQNYL
uniref:metabotropic glutamate receptor 3-like n=1 Tax=Ciona intestinalis TaxID=7719 RepID=UPI000180C621|nr:metabotropic glutamate receptor 3-like [Ciona intestinalis]|eukprot:XP_009857999.2 metabotropic glutamate receptor 3-like [Ciona intestinalis]